LEYDKNKVKYEKDFDAYQTNLSSRGKNWITYNWSAKVEAFKPIVKLELPLMPVIPEPYNYLDITQAEFRFGGFGSPTAGYINPVANELKSFGVRG